jgi:hypothetical protein
MDIFISYRDSAGAAEIEFRRLFRKLGHSEWFRLPAISTGSDGWSRMLPGLVCDLCPEDNDRKSPTIFMGMLGEHSMLSCALESADSLIEKPPLRRALDIGNNNFQGQSVPSLQRSDRLDFVSRTVDGTVSIQDIAPRYLSHAYNWPQSNAPGFADPVGSHFRFPNLDFLEYGSDYGSVSLLNNRMRDFLGLLDHTSAEHDAVLRRLVRDYHCRFAWASVQLDETTNRTPSFMSDVPFGTSNFAPSEDREGLGHLKAFWEKRGLLMRPFGLSPYGSLVERRGPISWPYWLQFLILISKAGRRANATFRKYRLPRVLKFSRKVARKSGRGPVIKTGRSPSTIGQLFRGRERRVPIVPGLQQRKQRAVLQREVLLEIRRSLIVPGVETILSLYRGDAVAAPVVIRKPGDKD